MFVAGKKQKIKERYKLNVLICVFNSHDEIDKDFLRRATISIEMMGSPPCAWELVDEIFVKKGVDFHLQGKQNS